MKKMNLQIFASLLSIAVAQMSVAGCWSNDNSGNREFFAFYNPWPDSALMSHGDTSIEFSYNVRSYSFDLNSMSFYAEPIGHPMGVVNVRFFIMRDDLLVGDWRGMSISLSRPPQLRPPDWCLMQTTTLAPTPVNTPAATLSPTPVPMPPITLPPAGAGAGVMSTVQTNTNTAIENLNSNSISSSTMTMMSTENATANASAGSVSDTTPSSVNLGLIIGCSVGGVLCLIAVLILVALFLKKRTRAEHPSADASVRSEDSRSSNVYGTVPLRMSESDMGFPQSTGPPTIGTYSSAASSRHYVGAKQLGMQGNNDYQEMEIIPE
jgi:hypothetical protein